MRPSFPIALAAALFFGGPALAGKKANKKKNGTKEREKHVLLSFVGGMGGGWLDMYEDDEYRKDFAEDGFSQTNAVGFGPGLRGGAAVPLLVSDDKKAVLCAAVEGRWSQARYAQAPTTASLLGTNAGTSSSLVDDGSTVDLDYTLRTFGYGTGVSVSARNFYGTILAGKTVGSVETSTNGTTETTAVEGRYFAVTPGYRLRLSKHLSLLGMAEGLIHPSGIVAEDPAAAFPLSDQLAIPAYTFTALVGIRVDL